jgi:hypothetical protein
MWRSSFAKRCYKFLAIHRSASQISHNAIGNPTIHRSKPMNFQKDHAPPGIYDSACAIVNKNPLGFIRSAPQFQFPSKKGCQQEIPLSSFRRNWQRIWRQRFWRRFWLRRCRPSGFWIAWHKPQYFSSTFNHNKPGMCSCKCAGRVSNLNRTVDCRFAWRFRVSPNSASG